MKRLLAVLFLAVPVWAGDWIYADTPVIKTDGMETLIMCSPRAITASLGIPIFSAEPDKDPFSLVVRLPKTSTAESVRFILWTEEGGKERRYERVVNLTRYGSTAYAEFTSMLPECKAAKRFSVIPLYPGDSVNVTLTMPIR